MTERDIKIIKDAEEQGIPIFVFTAKDKLSIETLAQYHDWTEEDGCSEEFVKGVDARIDEFANWRNANSDKVKLPD